MGHLERMAALVILVGVSVALIASLILFVCCQLVYKIVSLDPLFFFFFSKEILPTPQGEQREYQPSFL